MATSPKFCIYGAGAIGGTIAAPLARGQRRSPRRDSRGPQRGGLRLIVKGETVQATIKASADPAELGPQDYLIIAVKAPALPGIASRIGPLLAPETP